MGIKLDEKDIAAIEKKMLDPDADVCCPRCGNKLRYRAFGNSFEVKCPTKECIQGTSRGV